MNMRSLLDKLDSNCQNPIDSNSSSIDSNCWTGCLKRARGKGALTSVCCTMWQYNHCAFYGPRGKCECAAPPKAAGNAPPQRDDAVEPPPGFVGQAPAHVVGPDVEIIVPPNAPPRAGAKAVPRAPLIITKAPVRKAEGKVPPRFGWEAGSVPRPPFNHSKLAAPFKGNKIPMPPFKVGGTTPTNASGPPPKSSSAGIFSQIATYMEEASAVFTTLARRVEHEQNASSDTDDYTENTDDYAETQYQSPRRMSDRLEEVRRTGSRKFVGHVQDKSRSPRSGRVRYVSL